MKINYKNLIYIIVGVLFISYMIYIRIFLVRLPKYLYFIQENTFKPSLCIFTCISVVTCLFMVINSFRYLMKNSIKSTNIFVIIADSFSNFLDNALYSVYNFGISFIADSYDKVSVLSNYFYKLFHTYCEYNFLFILYAIRIIILTAFLIDVFIYFKLFYFYKSLFLLCISLVIRIFFFILRDFALNLDDIKPMLIIEDRGIDEESQLPITNYKLQPGFEQYDLRYTIEQFIICNKLTGYLEMYDRYANFFNPRVNIFIYTLYLLGWLYVLYVNFILFW